MAKAEGTARGVTIGAKGITKGSPTRYDADWNAVPVTDPNNWRQTGWLYSPEGDLLLNNGITNGTSADHSDASAVVMRRLGIGNDKRRRAWYEVSLRNGWMQPRFWGVQPGGYLSIRTIGRDSRTLRRVQGLVDKIRDLGVPVQRNKINIMYDMFGEHGEQGSFWNGSYADLMSASSWRDLE